MLECLPNELILYIFDYLHAVHLFQAFFGLNQRLNHLLTTYSSYHLDFRFISKATLIYFCEKYFPVIQKQIVALSLSDDDETPHLSHSLTIDPFCHLRSLTLYCVSTWSEILPRCPDLVELKLIRCLANSDDGDQHDALIDKIWRLSKLRSCTIDETWLYGQYFATLTHCSSSLKSVYLKNLDCDLMDLFHLCHWTSSLRHLTITIIAKQSTQSMEISLPHLISLNLSYSGPSIVLKSLCSNFSSLKSLKLDTSRMVLNGCEWEKIIRETMPRLKEFHLKMNFQTSSDDEKEKEEKIHQLLTTFESPFWTVEHQWFIRCEWIVLNPTGEICLYTIPYAFDEYRFLKRFYMKSTSTERNDSSLYNQVKMLQHIDDSSNSFCYYSYQFDAIEHLALVLPCNQSFLCVIPTLSHLKSLDVTLLLDDFAYRQLQLILDRSSQLFQLTFSHLLELNDSLFHLSNRSIRRLDFFTKGSMLYNWYFTDEQCSKLIHSPLGQQCQTLTLDLKSRHLVLKLLQEMIQLQSLTFQCRDDSGSRRDDLIQWLNENLPSTCSIFRDQEQTSIIHLWIR